MTMIWIVAIVVYIIGFCITYVFICRDEEEMMAALWPVILGFCILSLPFIGFISLLNWLKGLVGNSSEKDGWERKS